MNSLALAVILGSVLLSVALARSLRHISASLGSIAKSLAALEREFTGLDKEGQLEKHGIAHELRSIKLHLGEIRLLYEDALKANKSN
jgi:hypothetical protein